MKFVSKKAIQKIDERRKGMFWSLVCLLFALSTLYVYYVNTAALNGVRWEDAAKKTSAAEVTVSELEGKYLSQKKTVTLALASSLGFEDATRVTFLTDKRVEVSVR